MAFEDLGLLFFTALILSLLLTPASISLAQKFGAMDSPSDRSVHTRIMPRMGGLGMAAAALIALALFSEMNQSVIAFLLSTLFIVATGVFDDLYQVKPYQKMVGQVIACVLFLMLSGLRLNTFGDILGLGSIDFPPMVAFAVSLFAMIGIVNAFNLSDGLDGLAAGVTMIAAIFMGTLALQSQNWLAVIILISLLGATLGFLKFNTYPAMLFMGDTGSLTLGFFMACLIVYLVDFNGAISIQPVTLAIILALPISDTLFVMIRRMIQGKSPVSADRSHLHHRLLGLGLSHSLVVIIIYMLAFYFGLLALALHHQPESTQLLAGVISCIMMYVLLYACEKKGYNALSFSFLQKQEVQLSSNVTSLVGKSLKGFRFVILFGLLLPIAFVESAPAETHNLLLGVFVMLLFAYPWKEHTERLNIAYGLLYLTGVAILYVWNISTYADFSLPWYTFLFVAVLSFWSLLKIRFKRHSEVFLTSGLEVILVFTSWFVPYTLLPVLQVSEAVMDAAKTSCLEAIPLFIAMKIVIRRHPDRNYLMVGGLLIILLLMLIVL